MKRTTKLRLLATMTIAVLISTAMAQDLPITDAPAGAKVMIVSPKDGDTVSKEFVVIFGLEGMGIAPAGIDIEGTGHHHLLVDQDALPEEGKPMGNPPLHFGKGQTQTTLSLAPGRHTLQLIVGDKLHIPHNPPIVSKMITIEVKQ